MRKGVLVIDDGWYCTKPRSTVCLHDFVFFGALWLFGSLAPSYQYFAKREVDVLAGGRALQVGSGCILVLCT